MTSRGIAIVGASGLVGGALLTEAANREIPAVGTYHSLPFERGIEVDFARLEHVERVAAHNPEIVFVPAGYTNVDGCEDPATWEQNVDAPLRFMERLVDRTGARLVWFSTDYVFDGAAGPYSERDPIGPLQAYGRQKAAVEVALLARLPEALICRTTVVYGLERHGKNFAYRALREASAGRALNAPEDELGTPTYAPQLACAALRLALEHRATGVVHVAGRSCLSRVAFARALLAQWGLDPELIHPVSSRSIVRNAARPLSAGLISERYDLSELGMTDLTSALASFYQTAHRELPACPA